MTNTELTSTKVPCKACKSDIDPNAKICTLCKTPQGEQCVICKQWMLEEARRCNACTAYQKGWRRHFPFSQTVLTLLIALVAVVSSALTAIDYFLDYHSHTSLIVTNVNNNAITVYAWNTGRKPSTLVRGVLEFGNLPIDDVDLEPIDKTKTVIPPMGAATAVTIELRVPDLTTKTKAEPSKTQNPIMRVEIEESSGRHRIRRVPLPADVIEKMVGVKKALGQVKQAR